MCPPFLAIPTSVDAAKGSSVAIGAQDMHWEKEGAYTGEICCGMLQAVGITHVIIGHSERRHFHEESSERVAQKFHAARKAGLDVSKLTFPTLAVAGKDINSGERAHAFAGYMRIHALEATGGFDVSLKVSQDWEFGVRLAIGSQPRSSSHLSTS